MAFQHPGFLICGMDKPESKELSAGRAIRLKCLDCSGGSSKEVRMCNITTCPLHPFRFGKTRPHRPQNKIDAEGQEE